MPSSGGPIAAWYPELVIAKMASATSFDTVSLSNRIRMLLLKNLIIICKDEGLAHSGVKSALQGRIIARE